MSALDRTPEQRQEALDEAKRTRRHRAKLIREVTDGNVSIFDVLDTGQRGSGDLIAGHVHVGQLVTAINGIGPKTAAWMLEATGVADDVHVNAMTEAQVAELKLCLTNWAREHGKSL